MKNEDLTMIMKILATIFLVAGLLAAIAYAAAIVG